jgi:hypothetical protein
LNERWLLTRGSCITPGIGIAAVTGAVGSSGTISLYSGLVRNYVHPYQTLVHDVGLVYLDDRGLDLAATGKAKLYADPREPWHDESEPTAMTWAGWGYAGADCSMTTHRLRVADLDLIQAYGINVAAIDRDAHRACSGDGGSQFLVTRGGEHLQIALYTGIFDFSFNGTGLSNVGALYSLNRTWIEDTIAAETSRAFVPTWTNGTAGGYAFRQGAIASDGFEPLGGYEYRCADILKDGSVGMRDCSGVDSQRWAFPASGEILAYGRPLQRDRRCLAIDSTAIDAKLHVKDCDGTNFQRFAYTQDGRLRSAAASTRCLKAQGAGQPIVVASCQTGAAQQMWSTSPIPPP